MKCNKCKIGESEFLIYGDGELKLPEGLEVIQEDVDPSVQENKNLQILNYTNFNPFRRTADTILEEEGIRSYSDLASAYFLLKIKKLNKSKRVRDLVFNKYQEIIELIKDESGKNSGDDGSLLKSNNSN